MKLFHWGITAFLLWSAVFTAQAQSPKRRNPQSPSLPTVRLEFSKDQDVPMQLATASNGKVVPQVQLGVPQASSDGNIYIEATPVSDLQHSTLLAIVKANDSYSAIGFSMQRIIDLHDVHWMTYYPGNSTVAFLVMAVADDALTTKQLVFVNPETGERVEKSVKNGERHDYIVTFDSQGNYKDAVRLELPFWPERIALFPSGLYLVAGRSVDSEHKTELAFVNGDGTFQRFLETERQLQGSEKAGDTLALALAKSLGIAALPAGASLLGIVQILPFQDKIFWIQPGVTWFLEISEAGVVRRVSLRLPEGSVIDHFIPSGDKWYVSLRPNGETYNKGEEHRFYEVNPLTGGLVRRFETGAQYVGAIACEQDGEFRSLDFNKDGFTILHADAR